MIDFISENWAAILAGVAALLGAGFLIKLIWAKSGRDTNVVNQKGATAKGDNVGRDKITRENEPR